MFAKTIFCFCAISRIPKKFSPKICDIFILFQGEGQRELAKKLEGFEGKTNVSLPCQK